MKQRIAVGLSGGVDSSVAAALLKERGFDVVGIFMRNWHEEDEGGHCNADEDFFDVKRVAGILDIPYFSVDFSREYADRVFELFVNEYKAGRTPNPDVLCNREIKFGPLLETALKLGAAKLATGHYANTKALDDGLSYLIKSADPNKDQTYFLNQLTYYQLNRAVFPLGALSKPEVRALAEKYRLPTAKKKDSTGICFIGERRFREFLARYIPMREGSIRTLDGREVGRHSGVFYYTVGQRRGLGLGGDREESGGRWFVIKKDVENNILYVSNGDESALYQREITVGGFNYITKKPDEKIMRVNARIRHRQPEQDATAEFCDDIVKIIFDKEQRAPACGQYAVLYNGDICIGGGVIL